MLKRENLIPFSIGVICLLLSLFVFRSDSQLSPKSEKALSEFIESQKEDLQKYADDLQRYSKENQLFNKQLKWHKLYDEKTISLFILKGKELIYWSEDESPLSEDQLVSSSDFVVSPTTVHLKSFRKRNDTIFIAAKQIARKYPYQNSYLISEIDKAWAPYQSQLEEYFDQNSLSIDWPISGNHSNLNENSQIGTSLLFVFSIILILIWLPRSLTVSIAWSAAFRIAFIVIARFLILEYDPLVWSTFHLFDPAAFSLSDLNPTTGDLLINSVCILAISYQLLRILKKHSSMLAFILSFSILIGLSYYIIDLLGSAILNSQFSYELDNIFKLDLLSYISFISFGVLFMACLIWLRITFLSAASFSIKWLPLSITLLLTTLFYFVMREQPLSFSHFLFLLVISTIYYLRHYRPDIPDLIFSVIILLCFSAITTYLIDELTNDREASYRQVLLMKLAEERDPLVEYLFRDVQNEIRADDSLQYLLKNRWTEREVYQNYLRTNYFNGYWDRYRINLTLCSDSDSILIGGSNLNQNCFEYFQERIYREGDQISSINLFQLVNLAGRIDYIGEIKLGGDEDYRLFLELSRDYFSEDLGYPELFLNEEDRQLHLALDEYSYAVYYQNELINSEGDYVYTLHPSHEEVGSASFYSYQTTGFKHTILKKNENIIIILSKKKLSLLDYMSRITYLLVLYGLLFLIFSLSLSNFPFYHRLIITDFSTKIRFLITATLLTALLLFLAGTTYYIKEQYEEKNAKAIEEKLRSISLELDQKLGMKDTLDLASKTYVTSVLIKFSNVFYTDINLYQANGKLYASSRPELFHQKLKSERMHPFAFGQIVKAEKSKLVQEESIGTLGYLSAYIPFKNRQNELLAYLNLPYFARQEELEEEISAFLVPTINIYVIIFTISLFISFLMVNQISKPLLLIRRHISGLKLGQETELIDWQSEDEIGELVKEYNRIAIELGESATELAKTERETAWREMAKQIAHEIKNPLTPMKLSIQHLQRSSAENGEDLQEKIKKTSETLISQIDSLTAIAEAFSSFAKFPERELQDFELYPIIKEVSHLYVGQAEIRLSAIDDLKRMKIRADRDLILRIFNNLIKNAVQAYEKEGIAKIELKLLAENSNIIVEVVDNGKGISLDQAEHIFDPSFTTKSSGTGLGLAIVKRSMEQMGGQVKMNSDEGVGTTFTLTFPQA